MNGQCLTADQSWGSNPNLQSCGGSNQDWTIVYNNGDNSFQWYLGSSKCVDIGAAIQSSSNTVYLQNCPWNGNDNLNFIARQFGNDMIISIAKSPSLCLSYNSGKNNYGAAGCDSNSPLQRFAYNGIRAIPDPNPPAPKPQPTPPPQSNNPPPPPTNQGNGGSSSSNGNGGSNQQSGGSSNNGQSGGSNGGNKPNTANTPSKTNSPPAPSSESHPASQTPFPSGIAGNGPTVNGVTLNGDSNDSNSNSGTGQSSTSSSSGSQSSSTNSHLGLLIGGAVFAVVIIAGLGFIYTLRAKRNKESHAPSSPSNKYDMYANVQTPIVSDASPSMDNTSISNRSPVVSLTSTSPTTSPSMPDTAFNRAVPYEALTSTSAYADQSHKSSIASNYSPATTPTATLGQSMGVLSPYQPPILLNNGIASPLAPQNQLQSPVLTSPYLAKTPNSLHIKSPFIPAERLGKHSDQPPLLLE
ncbi:hypothetical protein HK103_006613 [Boothiomyces macroporosus]|uniref:Uncharacterized protein n=1 Tax=Boothiomyces macroporosus TaxID=261099 RepID=A0AAD5UEA4_9FUNG|nr:hypothetical protein HK103_006613 [Boothiomyces macroporosus]